MLLRLEECLAVKSLLFFEHIGLSLLFLDGFVSLQSHPCPFCLPGALTLFAVFALFYLHSTRIACLCWGFCPSETHVKPKGAFSDRLTHLAIREHQPECVEYQEWTFSPQESCLSSDPYGHGHLTSMIWPASGPRIEQGCS